MQPNKLQCCIKSNLFSIVKFHDHKLEVGIFSLTISPVVFHDGKLVLGLLKFFSRFLVFNAGHEHRYFKKFKAVKYVDIPKAPVKKQSLYSNILFGNFDKLVNNLHKAFLSWVKLNSQCYNLVLDNNLYRCKLEEEVCTVLMFSSSYMLGSPFVFAVGFLLMHVNYYYGFSSFLFYELEELLVKYSIKLL